MYGPKDNIPNLFEQIGQICERIGEANRALVILAGNFNIAMLVEVDTAKYVRENNTRVRDALVTLMGQTAGWIFLGKGINVNNYVKTPILRKRIRLFLFDVFNMIN